MNQLGRVALELRCISLEQSFKTFPRFRPIFSEKRNLGEVEAGVPKFRIGRERFLERGFGLIVLGLPHQDHAAKILRFGEIGLARVDAVEFLERLVVIGGAEFAERLVVH